MREDLTIDDVMEVARAHSIRVAVGWSGFSISTIRRLRREEGFERGRGHPSREEMEKERPRADCPCRFCLDTRKAVAHELANKIRYRIRARNDPDPSWRNEAPCAGAPADFFYPQISDLRIWTREDAPGLELCESCPVIERCLEYALNNREDDGVWGGACPKRRRQILKGRASR